MNNWIVMDCVAVDYLHEIVAMYVCRCHARQTRAEMVFNGLLLWVAWAENIMWLSSSSCNMGVAL